MDSKNKKIIIAIVIVILISILIIGVCFITKNNKKEEQENIIVEEVKENEISEEVIDDDEQENVVEEQIENTNIENKVNQEQPEQPEQPEQLQNQVIGREEQESITENQGPTPEEKVIELAKNKWGVSDNSVTFNIMNHDGDIYMVSVNDKDTTAVKAWYQVNLSTGEVTQ